MKFKFKFIFSIILLLGLCLSAPVQATPIGNGRNFDDDFIFRVAQGLVDGWSFVEKFGENPAITTATDPEDIWSQGGVYTFSTTADIDTVSSSHTGDTIDVVFMGLDTNWDLVSQTVTLTGQTKVTLTTPLVRFFRGYNGNGTALQGDVYVYVDGAITDGVPDVATTIRGKISLGSEQTEMAIYTVPADTTGYFLGGYVSVSRATSTGVADFTSRLRTFESVPRVVSRIACSSSGSSSWQYQYPIPLGIPAKSDLYLRVDAVSATLGVAGGFTVLLRDDSTSSNGTVISCASHVWTLVATGVTDGTLHIQDLNQNWDGAHYTIVDTGDAAPTLEPGQDGNEAVVVSTQSTKIKSSRAVDVYIFNNSGNVADVLLID